MAKKQDPTQSRLTFDAAGNWHLSSAPIVPAAISSSARSRTTARTRKTPQWKKELPEAETNSSPSSSPAPIEATASEQSPSGQNIPDQLNGASPAAAASLAPTNIPEAPADPSSSATTISNSSNETPAITVASQSAPSGNLSPRSQRRAYRKAYQQNFRNASAATFELLLNHLSDHYPAAIWEYAALDPAPKVYRLATAAYHLITQLQHKLWPDTFAVYSSSNTLDEGSDNGNANLKPKAIAEEPPTGRTPSGLISQAKTNKGRDKSYDAVEKLIEVLDSDLRPKNTKIKGLPDQKAWAPAMVMIQRLERELREEGIAFEGEMGVQMGDGKGKGVGSDMVRNGEVYPPFLGV